MKRRTVIWLGLASAGALVAGWGYLPPRQRLTGGADKLDDPTIFTPNAWVSIDRTGAVTLFMPRAEMGQGTHTGLAMLLAEELSCPLKDIRIAPAPIASVYNNLAVATTSLPFRDDETSLVKRAAEHFSTKLIREFGFMVTGGSTSIPDLWVVLREAGAMARETLRAAAARRWNVPLAECTARAGQVVHPSGEVLNYGDLVALGESYLEPVKDYTLKKPEEWSLIGKPERRLEAKDKVTGRALFATDVHEDGMLFAELEFSPYVDGKLAAFNEEAARAIPGVVEVLRVDAAGGAPAAVAVLADQRWRAKRAVEALAAEWVAGPAGPFEQKTLDAALNKGLLDGAEVTVHRDVGMAEKVIADSGTVVRADYAVPFLAHAAMEPLGCTVKFEGDKATVWAGVQIFDAARKAAAAAFGLEPEAVKLVPTLMGGAFGRRLESDFIASAAAIGRAAPGKLVQVQWRREDDMRHDFYRPAVRARFTAVVELGAGIVAAYKAQSAGQSVTGQAVPRQLGIPASKPDRSNVEGSFDQAYEFGHHKVVHSTVDLPVPIGFWRSVGHSQQAFFNESFIDELAIIARVDPVEFRLRHLVNHPQHSTVLKLAAEKGNWRDPPTSTPEGRPIGRGVALHESFGSIVAVVADVSADDQGRPSVHRVVVAIDCGTPVNPNLIIQQVESSVVYALSATLYGRITHKEGRVEQENFDSYPVLRMAETPQIETWIVRNTRSPGGVGEPAVPPVAPAVTNALAAITGRRHRRLPLIGA